MITPGDVLENRYVIEQILGAGGSADVYQARDSRLGKKVAIKASRPEAGAEPEQFEREARLLADLDHPAIVPVTDYFESDGRQCLVMAFVEGRDLQQVLDQASGYLQPLQVLQWADEICDILAYLHGRSPAIIVRDLKPSNLMLEDSGRLRLIDFGIARRCVPGLSTTHAVRGLGTDGYAAIEQYTGAPTDPRTDIYSLGATLYTLFTHLVPPLSVALLSGDASLQPPGLLNPDAGPEIEAFLLRMMAVQKADRFQDIAHVRAEIRTLIQQLESPQAASVAPPAGNPPSPGLAATAPASPWTLLSPPGQLGPSSAPPQEPGPRPVLPAEPTHSWGGLGCGAWPGALAGAFGPLRFLSPVTTIYNGSREHALQVLCRTLEVGLCARILPDWDPLMRGARWIVIVEHPV